MKFINLSEARKNWAEIIDHVEKTKEHICLVRYKTPVAYIIPVEDVYELIDQNKEEKKED